MENNIQNLSTDIIDDPVIAMRTDIDEDYISELGRSIKDHGLINPISVKKVGERYEVIAGHQRLLACRRMGILLVPSIVRDLSSEESLIVTAHENLVRQDVGPVDEALFLGRLVAEKNLTPEQISKMLRRSAGWVETRLNMLAYPEYMLVEISSGRIGLGVAKWLMKIEDEATRRNWLEPAARDGINEATAERWYNQWKLNVLPVVATPDAIEAVSGGQAPPETAIGCAKCGQPGYIKNMTTVWIHKDCPADPV